jgi:uncharacterized protein (TIGR00255 family)
MIKSMTGYGRGESVDKGYRVVAEINSVNRKQLEFAMSLPREFDAVEGKLRSFLSGFLSRGRIQVRVQLSDLEGNDCAEPRINQQLAEASVASLQALAGRMGTKTEVNLELLTRIPGVLKIDPKIPDADNIWATLKSATEQALNGLISMRETEGNHLLQDLTDRINTMRESLSQIQSKASELPAKHRQVLMDRLQQAGLEQIDLNDERILKELVLFADKSDISEEITRLESHFEHFNTLCANQKQVGRSLDFLAQEMFREINTIGSKASNHEIAHVVVSLKTELEKFREQVQNLE